MCSSDLSRSQRPKPTGNGWAAKVVATAAWFPMRSPLLAAAALAGLIAPMAQAQMAQAQMPMEHHHHPMVAAPMAHRHGLGPAGSTYDLRWIDAMVQHHTGALRMSEFVFDIGVPGVGSLAKTIWKIGRAHV